MRKIQLILIILEFLYLLFQFECFCNFRVYTKLNVLRSKNKHSSDNIKNKIRIKLLTDVPNLGKKDDIAYVSISHFDNLLLPNKMAQKISDLDYEKNILNNQLKKQDILNKMQVFKEVLSGKCIVIRKKVGSNAQLFGSVTAKSIMEKLKEHISVDLFDYLKDKYIRLSMATEDSLTDMSIDIRKTGKYRINVNLYENITTHFFLSIIDEKD